MKKLWVILGSLMLGSVAAVSARNVNVPADASDTSRENDKAAAKAASSAADKWAGSVKEVKPAPVVDKEQLPGVKENKEDKQEAPKETPKEAAKETTPPPTEKMGVLTPTVPRVGLNEMRGKLLSKSYDPRTVRLLVAGGFNVEFTYDPKTSIVADGKKLSIEDLGYNDDVAIRYIGKDLYAIEIERVSKALRPE